VSTRALETATQLAAATGASLKLLSVVEPFDAPPLSDADKPSASAKEELYDDLVAHRREEVKRALEGVGDDVSADGELPAGDPGKELAEAAEHGLDLLVVGSRGYGPIRTVLLGGVSSRIIRTAACPVLVVPRGGAAAEADSEVEAEVAG